MKIMYNDKEEFTRLTLEQSDKKIVWEKPYEDVDGVDDMMQAIYTIMIGMTFSSDTIYSAMASYLNEHAKHLFYVSEISDEKED